MENNTPENLITFCMEIGKLKGNVDLLSNLHYVLYNQEKKSPHEMLIWFKNLLNFT